MVHWFQVPSCRAGLSLRPARTRIVRTMTRMIWRRDGDCSDWQWLTLWLMSWNSKVVQWIYEWFMLGWMVYDGLPIENGGSFHGFLYVYRRVGVFCPGRSGVPNSSRGLSHLPQGDLSHLPVDDGDFFGRRTGSHDMPWHAMRFWWANVTGWRSADLLMSIDVYFPSIKYVPFSILISGIFHIYFPSGLLTYGQSLINGGL